MAHVLSVYSTDGLDEGHYGAACGPPIYSCETLHVDWKFLFRRSWSPDYDTGPRNLEEEPRMDTP
jgi:hypothetical protein